MKRKIKTFFYFIVFASSVAAAASPLALVYENEEAVLNGKASFGTVVEEGIVVGGDLLGKTNALLAAPVGEKLRYASLIRLDMQLNIAILSLGDAVQGTLIQDAHQLRSTAVKNFLPAEHAALSQKIHQIGVETQTGPFELKINGRSIGSEPIELPRKLKKSKFKLDVVYKSTAPLWNIQVELESDPKLSFWKQGRKSSLNDVPESKFRYSQQVLFRPMTTGKSIQVPIEVFFIGQDDYIWTFKVTSRHEQFVQKARIRFK